MKPAPFEYFCPATLDEAMSLLARHGGDAKPLAGGQSLIPAMNFRLAAPAVLVDLNALSDLARVTVGDHHIPGAHPDMVPWLLKKKIHIWGVDCVSTDHPMNLPIGRFLGKGMHIENLGGDIDAKELQNRRLILGCFPWKFRGGEAAFARCVAFTGDWKP